MSDIGLYVLVWGGFLIGIPAITIFFWDKLNKRRHDDR